MSVSLSEAICDPITVHDYRASFAKLAQYDAVPPAQKPDYYMKNKRELLAEHQVLEDVQTAYDAIVEANKQAMAHYGQPFLCNQHDVTIDALIGHYVKRRARETHLAEAEISRRADLVPIQLVITDEMLRLQPCPGWRK